MRETKQFLKDRWESDFKGIGETITKHLQNSKGLETLSLPKTVNNLIDLRGYSIPKKYVEEKSNSGKLRKYVGESLRIKNVKLCNLDFSLADFERCYFINCDFSNSKFDETRFVGCTFWGCLFQGSEFLKTNFGYSTFSTDGIIFRKSKINFLNNKFNAVNFSEVLFSDQIINDSIFNECRFGAATFSHCEMKNLDFHGEVRNLFITKNKNAQSVNFINSELIDLQMRDTTNEGFIFKSKV